MRRILWMLTAIGLGSCVSLLVAMAQETGPALPTTNSLFALIADAVMHKNWGIVISGIVILVVGALKWASHKVPAVEPFFASRLGGWLLNALGSVAGVLGTTTLMGEKFSPATVGTCFGAIGGVAAIITLWQDLNEWIASKKAPVVPPAAKVMLLIFAVSLTGIAHAEPTTRNTDLTSPIGSALTTSDNDIWVANGTDELHPSTFKKPALTEIDIPIGNKGFVLHGTYTLIGPGGVAFDFDGTRRSLNGGAAVGLSLFHVPIAGQPFDVGVAVATLTDTGGTPIVGAQLTILTFAYLGYGLSLFDANGNINPFAGTHHGSMIYGGWMVPIDTIIGLIIKIANGTSIQTASLLR